jgi:hypothetical protein
MRKKLSSILMLTWEAHTHIKFHIGTLLAYHYTNIHNWSKLCLLNVLKKIGPFTPMGFNRMPTQVLIRIIGIL